MTDFWLIVLITVAFGAVVVAIVILESTTRPPRPHWKNGAWRMGFGDDDRNSGS
jgi:hypothetical protein